MVSYKKAWHVILRDGKKKSYHFCIWLCEQSFQMGMSPLSKSDKKNMVLPYFGHCTILLPWYFRDVTWYYLETPYIPWYIIFRWYSKVLQKFKNMLFTSAKKLSNTMALLCVFFHRVRLFIWMSRTQTHTFRMWPNL